MCIVKDFLIFIGWVEPAPPTLENEIVQEMLSSLRKAVHHQLVATENEAAAAMHFKRVEQLHVLAKAVAPLKGM